MTESLAISLRDSLLMVQVFQGDDRTAKVGHLGTLIYSNLLESESFSQICSLDLYSCIRGEKDSLRLYRVLLALICFVSIPKCPKG